MHPFTQCMHEDSLYRFILFVLMQEGKSNVPFKLEAWLLGRQHAVKHYLHQLFAGCDPASFFHMKALFEQAEPTHSFHLNDTDIIKDSMGLMTGEIKCL